MKNITAIQNKLSNLDKKLYIVGGFCRDKILNETYTGDIDLVSDARPDEIKQVLHVVGEVGKKYGTCIVSEGGEIFELTTFRKDIGSINHRKPAEVVFTDSLHEDARRRDFTCNAIYYNPETGGYIDPTGGREDIENGIIRFVGDMRERILEDALRILRCIRFKNRYDFKLADENYWNILKQNITLLKSIPIERIRQELDKILLHESNAEALEDLKRIGFLELFIPELHILDGYPGNKYHQEGNVWEHTKLCLLEMNSISRRENINGDHKLILLWAILFHDIGKEYSFTQGEDGANHYYDHENIGAEIFKQRLAGRLKFSNDFTKKIYFIIKNHIRIFNIPTIKILTARKLMMHEYFDDLLLIHEANQKGKLPQQLDSLKQILKIYSDFKILLKTKEFLSGNDIMSRYPKLKAGAIGERLLQLNDQILVKD